MTGPHDNYICNDGAAPKSATCADLCGGLPAGYHCSACFEADLEPTKLDLKMIELDELEERISEHLYIKKEDLRIKISIHTSNIFKAIDNSLVEIGFRFFVRLTFPELIDGFIIAGKHTIKSSNSREAFLAMRGRHMLAGIKHGWMSEFEYREYNRFPENA